MSLSAYDGIYRTAVRVHVKKCCIPTDQVKVYAR